MSVFGKRAPQVRGEGLPQAGHRPRDPLVGLSGSVSARIWFRFCSGLVAIGFSFSSVFAWMWFTFGVVCFVLALRLPECLFCSGWLGTWGSDVCQIWIRIALGRKSCPRLSQLPSVRECPLVPCPAAVRQCNSPLSDFHFPAAQAAKPREGFSGGSRRVGPWASNPHRNSRCSHSCPSRLAVPASGPRSLVAQTAYREAGNLRTWPLAQYTLVGRNRAAPVFVK